MTDKTDPETRTSNAQMAEGLGGVLAMHAMLRCLIDNIVDMRGSDHREKMKTRCLSMIRHLPEAAMLPGFEKETRDAASRQVESIFGSGGSSNRGPIDPDRTFN